MRSLLKSIAPLRRAVIRHRMQGGPRGQSNEAVILRQLADRLGTNSFVEFGFHPAEFNCSLLLHDHAGLLVDGDRNIVEDARVLLEGRLKIKQKFLTLDSMDALGREFMGPGIFSIDVDGNDYWFLKALLPYRPKIICVEYNGSFLDHTIATPYDPEFDRAKKHPTGWYHGASLAALAKVCASHGYGLEAVSQHGGNAFFTETGKLDPREAWKPTLLRDRSSGLTASEQWSAIKDMPYEQV